MASKTSRTIVWIVLALVMVGLVGYGSTNFGTARQSVGRVGDTEIPARALYREINATLRAFQAATGQPIPIAQAQAMGLVGQALGRVVAAAALDNENRRIGLSIGDDTLRRQILSMRQFQNAAGVFDKDTYEFALKNSGLTVKEFEDDLRADLARGLLQQAVAGGVRLQPVYADTLYAFAREARDFTWARLDPAALEAAPPTPGEEDLVAWYEAHPADYTLPETKKITAAWLKPEAMLDQIEVDPAALQALYDERADQYNQPERRLVERLVFGSQEEARAAADAIEAGEKDFNDLVAERGLQLSDVDLGDVTKSALGPAGEAVFALEQPAVIGPVDTALGPAIFRMNAILPAQHTPLAEVADDLRAELAGARARRMIIDMIDDLDDALAGGATLEELADTTPGMELIRIDWTGDNIGGLAGFEKFREAAATMTEGDFPELVVLSDGGIFAMRVDRIDPPHLQPLDEVRDQVARAWQADARLKALADQAGALVERLKSGGESLSSLGLTEVRETGLMRNDLVDGTPPELIEQVFAMQPGDWAVVPDGDGVIIVHLDAITPADGTSEEAVAAKAAFSAQVAQELGLDIEGAYARALQDQAGITLNQAVIDAIIAQFP